MGFILLILIIQFNVFDKTDCSLQGTKNDMPQNFKLKKYQNTEGGYTIMYPSSWVLMEPSKSNPIKFRNPVRLKNSKLNESLDILYIDYQWEINLEEEFSKLIEVEKNKSESFSLIESSIGIINDLKGINAISVYRTKDVNISIYQLYCKVGKRLFIINCIGDAKNFQQRQDLYNEIMASFSPNK